MSEENNAGTSELQKLLDEGVASMAVGSATDRQVAPILVDITKEFLTECSSSYFLSRSFCSLTCERGAVIHCMDLNH
uniref:Uncharacterized protein n=1 Tax=Parascaris equorum TaxID=6256 RepID=A0A914RM03_PAREQ